MYRTPCKPYDPPLCYQSDSLAKFIHQLKVPHIQMIKDIKMNATPNKSKKDIGNNRELIIPPFCSVWAHPCISTLNGNNTLAIHNYIWLTKKSLMIYLIHAWMQSTL